MQNLLAQLVPFVLTNNWEYLLGALVLTVAIVRFKNVRSLVFAPLLLLPALLQS